MRHLRNQVLEIREGRDRRSLSVIEQGGVFAGNAQIDRMFGLFEGNPAAPPAERQPLVGRGEGADLHGILPKPVAGSNSGGSATAVGSIQSPAPPSYATPRSGEAPRRRPLLAGARPNPAVGASSHRPRRPLSSIDGQYSGRSDSCGQSAA